MLEDLIELLINLRKKATKSKKIQAKKIKNINYMKNMSMNY